MYREIKTRIVACLMLLAVLTITFSQTSLISNAVTVSNTDYIVNIKGDYVFLGNEIPGKSEIGTEYFMTYTVKDVKNVTLEQQGLIASGDITQRIPYENGGFIRYFQEQPQHSLMVKDATYFIRCTVAEGGFTYDIVRMKDGVAEEIYLDQYWGWDMVPFKHFGIWISGQVEAELIKVRCYDSAGKNLGVYLTPMMGTIIEDVTMKGLSGNRQF